nr:reverse transcriptase domain-containing protein [Tanacetum cinerariifolium]
MDFVIVDYESDPKVPLILGRPFLWTARALIDVHGKEMILRDGDERLTLNMRHDTSSYSNQPQKGSINFINVFNNSNLDSTKDPHPPLHDNQLSGSTTYPLLEEFADELPPEYDDNLQFDIESDLKEIEFLLYQDKDSSLKDSIDQKNRAHLADIFIDSIPEMFPNEHTLDYSSPPIFDVYADDFLEVESDAENIYNDPFDSKGEKIKESKLLIDELDLPCDFYPPPDSTTYFSNSLLEEFTEELALITYPPDYDDNLQFDIESDLKEIEFLLYQDKDSSLKDSIDQKDLANIDDNFVDPIPEMFTDNINVYDDPFDSKEEKIKEFTLLIDELDLLCDFLPPFEYDSFISQIFPGLMCCPHPTTRTRNLFFLSRFVVISCLVFPEG